MTVQTVRVCVNGEMRELAVSGEESAVEVLRDRLGLTGTKLACGEGVCGACTVQVDGVCMASCLLPATALDGRRVTTVEGFGPGLHPVQRAFIAHDALQCGYCTPGFVVEAIAFHDRWRADHGNIEPLRDDVTQALCGHLCRCGAYVGIIAAVKDACAGRYDAGGARGPRVDAEGKVTGRAIYTTDVRHDGQLEGLILRSPHPHARVLSIDFGEARALPGVHAVIDMLGRKRIVRYVGQEVAALAAVDRSTARRALETIKVQYEPLTAVVGMDAARSENAVRVYKGWWRRPPNAAEGPLVPSRWRGNVRGPVWLLSRRPWKARRLAEEARAAGHPFLVEGRWRTEAQIHAALEAHACVARWDGDRLLLHVSTQAAAHVAQQVAKRFGLPEENVRLIAEHVGGGFGAKLQLTPETVAAAELARAAGRPVRVVLERSEEMTVGGYRPGAEIDLALLSSRTGRLRALQIDAYADAGVAAGSQVALFARMMYPAAAKRLFDYNVLSHLPPGKPFRGPSGPVTAWALEQAVDEAAIALGEDPIVLRRRWDCDPLRQRLYDWAQAHELWRSRPAAGSQQGRFRRGVGVAAANWVYFFQKDCAIQAGVEGGRLYVATAVQDPGTGIRSVLAEAVAGAFGVEAAEVQARIGDTWLARGPISSASRTTATLLPAALAAAAGLRQQLAELLAKRRGLVNPQVDNTGIRHDGGFISWAEALASAPNIAEIAERPDDRRGASLAARPLAGTGFAGLLNVWVFRLLKLGIGRGYTGAVHVTEVEVDTLLGKTRVTRIAGGLAAGRLAAPRLARNQCHGGVIQGLGFALYEQRAIDVASGRVLTTGLEDYRIPGIGDLPEIELHFDEAGFEHVASGGVGLSELSTLGVAASIGNAVRNATGWRPYELPIRPDRLLAGMGS
jgi:xanthine dehydrogenase YagR molybdenum-binding subunit